MAKELNCNIGKWPICYLGISIGISAKRRVFWEPVIKKVRSKLSRWKADSLNQAGRLTLVKAVLDSVPIYRMNLHKIPTSVIKNLDRIRRDLLWGRGDPNGEQVRKLHLIAWDKICRPKDSVGLGLVPIKVRNLALLCKWFYKWERERGRCWNKWIREKYNFSRYCGLGECKISGATSDDLQAIISASFEPKFKGLLNKNCFSWTLRNGKNIFFWEDTWVAEKPLKDIFKRLYRLSAYKEYSVKDFLKNRGGNSLIKIVQVLVQASKNLGN